MVENENSIDEHLQVDGRSYLIKWLKSGKQENDESNGGFLIPEYINYPLPGIKPMLWRMWARIQFKLGWFGTGYRAFAKGTVQVEFRKPFLEKIISAKTNRKELK